MQRHLYRIVSNVCIYWDIYVETFVQNCIKHFSCTKITKKGCLYMNINNNLYKAMFHHELAQIFVYQVRMLVHGLAQTYLPNSQKSLYMNLHKRMYNCIKGCIYVYKGHKHFYILDYEPHELSRHFMHRDASERNCTNISKYRCLKTFVIRGYTRFDSFTKVRDKNAALLLDCVC